VKAAFTAARFHEAVLLLDRPVPPVLSALAQRGIVGGLDLTERYPELGHALLVCATETKLDVDIDSYAAALAEVMQVSRAAA
jgi:glycine dehydrogenase subunit 1